MSTSVPFILALVAVAGLGVALVAQLLASIADDVASRRQWLKSVFNVGQYAVSVAVAGLVYAFLADTTIFGARSGFAGFEVLALVVAGLVMVTVNELLVSGVVSVSTGLRLSTILRESARDWAVTQIVMLSAAAIAALIAGLGASYLLLLAAPMVAAHAGAALSARRAREAQLDVLTGLRNRGQLHRELATAIHDAQQSDQHGPGLILIDVDRFKDVNDTLGHPVGDKVLTQLAERLERAMPEGASIFRLGGDEFAVIVPGGLRATRQSARELLDTFAEPVSVNDLELLTMASAGVAVAPKHGDTVAALMKNADIALYRAKIERDRMTVYTPALDVNSVAQLQLLADLRTALDDGQLSVVYQPQVALATMSPVGFEALVRWKHPVRGDVSPADFIPVAENSGLIFRLTAYVLDEALTQLGRWLDAGHDVRMSVNLSARHLSDLNLPTQIALACEDHDVPPHKLVLEVTETGVMTDPVRADIVIRELRELGVEVSIDDYGTGHASLAYLKRLEIDELKIDRSFVSTIRTDREDYIIVRSTVQLALQLGLRVVAEGIEDEATVAALRKLGGVVGQGYHLCRPASAAQVHAALSAPVGGELHEPAESLIRFDENCRCLS